MKTKLVNGFGITQGWNMEKYKGRIQQGSHPGSAAVKRKTLLKRAFIIYLAVALSLSAFAPIREAQSRSDLGGCSAIVDGSRLSIIGTEALNTIHVVGSERGIQVTCDGASDSFTGIEEMTMDGGGGDDRATVDNSNGLLGGLPISVYSQGSADLVLLVVLALLPLFEVGGVNLVFYGAPGPDVLQIAAGPLADRFDIASGPDPKSLAIEVTDIASGRQVADITGLKLEDLTVQMGEGDDEANISPLAGITTNIFGDGGNDSVWDHEYEFRPGKYAQQDYDFSGGIGVDSLKITSGALADRFDIASGTEANSVEVRLTDIASETPLANVTGSALEVLTVEMGDGNDQANVSLLQGISSNIFGESGGDLLTLLGELQEGFEDAEPRRIEFNGGPGFDVMQIVTGAREDKFDIASGADPNSIVMEVTDIATQTPIANVRGTALEVLTVEMGEGNDQAQASPLLGITTNILAQGGDDAHELGHLGGLEHLEPAGSVFDGGPGQDVLRIVSGALADQFDVRRGEAEDAVEVRVTDRASGTVTANIVASAVELTSIKMGAGNDILNKLGNVPTVLSGFGEEGDDANQWTATPAEPLPPQGFQPDDTVVGGPGHDKFTYNGTTPSEQYEIVGVPGPNEIPDPELRVTDMVTGLQLANVQFLEVEEVNLGTGDGDDRVEVSWDAALMSSLFILADLGRGNDSFLANLLPVLTELPTRDVQTARFEIDTGTGNDLIAFSHSAGSWCDVFFTAETGPGADTVNALLHPPPDDGIIGPEGLRLLQFNLVTGGNDDFVGLENQTGGESFNVFLDADLEGGNDTFEGRGGIHDANISPGRGVDTARVTPNFRPFVGDFERIVILE